MDTAKTLVILLQGNFEAEHLRAEIENSEVRFWSHEIAATVTDVRWRDRFLFTLKYEQLKELVESCK